MRWIRRGFGAVLLTVLAVRPCTAVPITIDFEGFADGTPVVSQYSNLTFSQATIATAGISLNELDFPPHSGDNVVLDDGGALTIAFAAAISEFSGFFTYSSPITLSAYDASHSLLAVIASDFSNNTGTSGDPGSAPNEFMQLSVAGISFVTVAGDPSGDSFVLDDASYITSDEPPPAGVPEPGTLTLMGVAAATGVAERLARRRRR
jgi:hypothetical protein